MIANLEKSVAVHIDTTVTIRRDLNAMKTTVARPNKKIAATNKEISKLSQLITEGNKDVDKLYHEISNLGHENNSLVKSNVKV